MSFIPNAKAFAENVMAGINPNLTKEFGALISCLSINLNLAPASRSKNIQTGSDEYIVKLANSFHSSRVMRAPAIPSTVPDDMVSVILNSHFKLNQNKLGEAKELHMLSMSAENIIGDLLERYIASVIEPTGWVWCSGSTVKSVDFIKPPAGNDNEWHFLQVKNRDNSENSSSSAIRLGTPIVKWHRTFSRTGLTNWEAFPDIEASGSLSEHGFIDFVKKYLAHFTF